MDPNQQPTQPSTPPPQPGPQPPTFPPQQSPQFAPQTQPLQTPQAPLTPTSYESSQSPNFDPNYLDSIAPPPPAPKFFSGSFGKIFFGLLAVVVIVVGVIVALSGKDQTADLQQIAVRLDNFKTVAKSEQKYLKSSNLSATNSTFQTWLLGNQASAEDLLNQGGVKKTQYSKTMIASEKKISDGLTTKLEDARLNAVLDRVYASTMAAESQKIVNLLNTMSKQSKSAKIRDFAKNASTNLQPIQKSFDGYVNDGN